MSGLAHAQSSPSDFTTGYRYDVAGRVTGAISPDPDGAGPLHYHAVRTTYDDAGNVLQVDTGELASWQGETVAPADWTGFTVTQSRYRRYDGLGRKTIEWDQVGSSIQTDTHYSYDFNDRLVCAAFRMNPAVYPTDAPAACTLGTTGPYGPDRITKNIYDAAGQLLKVQKAYGVTTANGFPTTLQQDYVTYTYDDHGNQTSVTDAGGNKASLEYDAYDRQTRWNFPSKTTPGTVNTSDYEAYTYDAGNNRLSLRKRDSSVIGYTYDALGRMTLKDLPGGTAADVYYGYDLRGLQLYARFVSGSGAGITNDYDGFGRLTSTTNNMSGTARTLSHQYDADGNRTRVTYPDSNYAGYQYDGLDRLDAANVNGTGLLGRKYDEAGRLYQNTSGSITYYTYDGMSRLTLQNETVGGTATVQRTFAYNAASQLVSRSRTNDAYAFPNYVTKTLSYTANGLNQYATVGSNTYGYDANGNLTSDGGITYTYDVENRLTGTSAGTNLIYDPLGRLYETNVGGSSVTRFLYDGDELVAEYDAAGTMLKRYIHGPGEDDVLAWFDGAAFGGSWSNVHLAKPDQQGSLVLWTDWNGGSSQINSYDEYGVPDAANVGRFQYTGQAWIPELGMYYYKARIYSPMLGRFMQTDPIGYKDQANLYAYVGNDPIDKRDPSGECPCVAVWGWEFVASAASDAAEGVSALKTLIGITSIPRPRYPAPLMGSPYRRPHPTQPTVQNSDIYDTDGAGKIGGTPADVHVGDSELPDAIRELDRSIAQRRRENDRFPRGNPNGDDDQRKQHQRYRGHVERIVREEAIRAGLLERLRRLTQ